MSLTDVRIRNARPTGKTFKLSDSDGLYLEVRTTGAKIWRYRFYLPNGKDSRYTIGEYPGVSLSDARAERDRVRELVRKGVNPTAARREDVIKAQAEAANTFKTVALEWIEKKRPTWTPGTCQQVESFLAINCYPAFGDKPIRDVTAHEILAVLRGMEERGSVSSALKIRQWCSAIFCYAVATLRAEADPAAALKGAVIPHKVQNSRCLTHDELRKYFAAASAYTGHPQTRLCLLLLPFLFVRQGELRRGRWEEMDLQGNLWTIPGQRMKMKRPHSVPLTPITRQLFEKLHALTGDKPLMFPGIKKPTEPLSDSTVNRAIEYLGFPSKQITSHDFRATASTTLYEAGFRREVIEKQLAHSESNRVVAAYNHAEYLPERREMMAFYEGWLAGFMPAPVAAPDI
ncbi:integrase arm-type DNA-binding domain-containing protein [Klebsiella variicola]|uniref:tyrosine-type recombinase/integrase n=1 Tax=Klebsiella variicola TaxID=244366 RepID=UPI001E618329|nr:integrase arm-type DNA-binding domain-containing protein [Klebsiella variicola]MCD9775831.1 integrase arm-type DNA-binding domain-containing protein [Klebsiella variicola subsp. variicola]HCI6019577.1 integrase arm-type DNA-binding domain-containing protein [Klebsiella quasipneumoniae subsp. quasipneumoniae]